MIESLLSRSFDNLIGEPQSSESLYRQKKSQMPFDNKRVDANIRQLNNPYMKNVKKINDYNSGKRIDK